MKFADVPKHIGEKVTINGSRDLGIDSHMRKYIYSDITCTIIKVTKGGKVYVQADDTGEFFSLPVRNLNLVGEVEPEVDPNLKPLTFTIEQAQPIKAMHGMDLDEVLTEMIMNELKDEENK